MLFFYSLYKSSDCVRIAVKCFENISAYVKEAFKPRAYVHSHVELDIELCQCAKARVRILLEYYRVALEDKTKPL